MSSPYPTAKAALDHVVREAVTAVLKPAGFRKTALNFHRRRGACVQIVNLQGSQASSADHKRIYVNVGVGFDDVCALLGRPISEKPKHYECQTTGFDARLEQLVRGAPPHWDFAANHDPANTTAKLFALTKKLVAELDCIDGPASFHAHRWFASTVSPSLNAQIRYVLGDHAGAREAVEAIARAFADRQNANRVEWWFEELGLKELAR